MSAPPPKPPPAPPAPRGTVEFLIDLGDSETMYLAFSLGMGGGPLEFKVFPSDASGDPTPYPLAKVLEKLAAALKIDALGGVATLSNDGIWKDIFSVNILPELIVTPSGPNPSLQAVLKVFSNGKYGLTIGIDPIIIGGLTIQIEPRITIYEFGIKYTKATGLKLDAVVDYGEVGAKNGSKSQALAPLADDGPPAAGGVPPWTNPTPPPVPPSTAQKVGYPFPTPATKDPSKFCVRYFGIGQRLGIDVDLNDPNPITKAMTELESELSSTTPTEVLPKLANLYHPDRDWFIAAHIILKGWDLKAFFNDPSLYGIEISSTIGAFNGFDFEILYQKLGPKNGVYYGAITLPTKFRNIELGAASLTLPNFKLWIYTDGDFRFAIGWPLWNDIFTVQVDIFTGGGGLYFGKLRSGDLPKPASNGGGTTPAVTYDPILEFGLGLELGLGRSFSAGPLSASLFVGMRGVFQGLLAWVVDKDKPGSGNLSNPPDYYWFSASISLVGQVNGSVDLAIVSLSFSVDLSITATVAFEKDCKSDIAVEAYVEVSATLKILFVHIHVSFHTTVHVHFVVGSGDCTADPSGPTNPDFQHAIPSGSVAALAASESLLTMTPTADELFLTSAPAPPSVGLHFLLYPAVDYTQPAASQLQAVAGLVMEKDQFTNFLTSVGGWLTSKYGGTWASVQTGLGTGSEPEPANFRAGLTTFLSAGSFTISSVDLTATSPKDMTTFVFAMPPALTLSSTELTAARDFFKFAPTSAGYGKVLSSYLGALSELDGRSIENSVEDDGHSMADHVFYDYMLLVCRQLAHEMVMAPDGDVTGQVGSVASHYLLYGLRLPKPGTQIPAPGQNWDEKDIAGLYELTGQQFAVKPPGGNGGTVTASLSVSPDGGALAQAFKFANPQNTPQPPTSATSHLPVPAATPPAPNPGWNQGGEITLKQRPGIVSPDLWLGVHNRVQWAHTDAKGVPTTQGLIQLPERVVDLAGSETVTLKLYPQPQPQPPKDAALTFSYALRIPLNVSTVSRRREADAISSGGAPAPPTGTELPGIYSIQGVDDADRDRLGELINLLKLSAAILVGGVPQMPDVSLHVLLPSADQSAFTSSDKDEAGALFLKTSLATTSSPGLHTAPIETLAARARAAALGADPLADIGPVAAPITDVLGALQLLYEASIVHAGGFFLSWPVVNGVGLPTSIFKDGTAELELLISMPDATSVQKDIQNVLVTTQVDTPATVYLSVMDGAGRPLPDPHPGLRQGSVGFEMDWNAPPDPAQPPPPFDPSVIQSLYRLTQFRINGTASGSSYETSVWSGAVGAISKGNGAPPQYLGAVPVWKFVNGVDADDPTQALARIGHDPSLDYRLVDVFGNALAGNVFSMSSKRLYEDPLVLPSTWPGAHVGYTIGGDGTGDPTLTVTLSFEPNKNWGKQSTAGNGTDLPHLIERYQQIVAQVSDPNLTVALATSIMNEAPTAADARTKLQSFAKSALEYVQALVTNPTLAPVAPVLITASLSRGDIAKLPFNIFRLTVDLILSRPANLVDPDALTRLPAAQGVTLHVRPLVVEGEKDDSPGPPTDPKDDAPLSLKAFGRAFEKAYAGFDAAPASRLKLTVRAEKTNHPTQSGPAELWAVRMSSKSGIALSVPTDVSPVAFTMEPISTELVSGSVDVTTYDPSLNPTAATHTFNGVALDDWMRQFLFAMDSLLSPSTAPVLAGLRPPATSDNPATPFQRLMEAKENLAASLAGRVTNVFVPQDGQTKVWGGDLASAQDKFEQSLLEDLSRAYTISVIMQTQVAVSETGKAEEHAKVPPRFYGALPLHLVQKNATSKSNGGGAGNQDQNSAFTISNATLALPEASGSTTQALTWTVSVKHPETDAFLDLEGDYRIGFMEHYIDLGADGEPVVDPDEPFGYVPSSWLRFVVTEDQSQKGQPDPLLTYPLNAVDKPIQAPIPLHEFPPPLTISSQKADADPQQAGAGSKIGDIIKAALKWRYTLCVAERELDAEQDDLWLEISYNLSGAGGITHSESRVGDSVTDARTKLFEALAQFATAYNSLSGLLPQLEVGAKPTPIIAQLAEILAGLAEVVSDALRPETETLTAAFDEPVQGGASDAPAPLTDVYVVEFLEAIEKHTLTVYAQVQSDSDQVIWPTIDGQAAKPIPGPPVNPHGLMEGLWKTATYDYSPLPSGKLPEMEIKWEPLQLVASQTGKARQTVRPQVKVVRNADLAREMKGTGMITNPALVYCSPQVAGTRLVPYVDVSKTIDVPFDADLPTTLTQILTPFFDAESSVGATQKFKVMIGYEYVLNADPSPTGDPLIATNAILLVDGLELTDKAGGGSLGGGAVNLNDFVKNVSDQIVTWLKTVGSNTGTMRWITLAISLFANLNQTELPLIHLTCVRIKLPQNIPT